MKQLSIAIRLPDYARYVLIDAAKFGIDRIDQVAERLRAEYPDAFHSEESLPERGFVHPPMTGIPHRRHTYKQFPPLLISRPIVP
ncbi:MULTISPECIES: hypothetical protein [Burkholderia]|uniref:hypothetical protein n=1 Tax=Burkholderia TaxID=32008 RepID=UPI001F2B006D|nr:MULTISPECIES: hypothetical protein [Burkholderia]